MLRKIMYIATTAILLTSCNATMDRALRSTDKDFILKAADDYFAKKKYPNALKLYEKVTPLVIATDDAPNVIYNTATANFLDKNYRLAAHQFKNFQNSYPKDPRAKDALFQSAFCFYKGSGEYNLDQENTIDAIKEMQNFIDAYPEADKVAEGNKYIEELQQKLEKKAFEIAKTYYKTTQYKAAATTFGNVLDDFPSTKYKEEVMMYILRSKYELAVNSIFDKKEGRIKEALSDYKQLLIVYPETKYKDEAEKIRINLEKEVVKHQELIEKYKTKIKA